MDHAALVAEWRAHRCDDPPYDREFIGRLPIYDRFRVMRVAKLLGVTELFDAIVAFTAFELKSKTVDEAYAYYGIQKTPEELETIRKQNLWVFE